MAPRPGYHPGSEGGEEEGEGRSSGGEDPVASRHRRRGRDSSVGSDSCGESAEPNPAGFTLPVMYPPGSKDRHKQPILRQKDVVAMKLREQQQYERMNRLTYGKSSPYGVPSEVPSLPVTRGVRSLLRFASSGEVSKVSDEEEGEGVGGEGEEEVDEEQEGSTRRSGDRSKQPSIRRSRRRRSPGVGVPTMSKADRLDPFAIIKRYELRAQLDRERRRLQQLQYQVNAARGSGVEHSSPEGDEGSGDGASAVSPGAIPTDGPAGGIALSGTKRSTSLRSHSGPLVHSQSALALSAPSGGDLTLPVPASPIMGSSPRSEYSEEFDSEGEESAPVAPGVGGVGATPRPVSEPAPVTNQPVLSPVQQPFYTTSEGSKVSPDPPAPKSLGKREKPTPFMATGSTPQLPPQLLASLRESGRSDSGLNLRMALRSFTHAWTNVDVPKPLLDRRQKSHRPKKASEAAEEGTVDIGSSVVKMPAINSKSWSQGLSVKK